MCNFDPTKPVEARDGRPARILASDVKGTNGRPIVALIEGQGREYIVTVSKCGSVMEGDAKHNNDLVNSPPRTMVYLSLGNAYETPDGAKGSTHNPWDILAVTLENSDGDYDNPQAKVVKTTVLPRDA